MSLVLGTNQFAQLSERRFEDRLAQVLAKDDSGAKSLLATSEGMAMMREQCAKARSFKMTAELDIARYVITAWLLGPDFDTRFGAMTEILNTDRLTPAQKAEAVERVCTTVMTELHQGKDRK